MIKTKHYSTMKKLIIPMLAIALAFSSSAFIPKKSNSNFFRYNGVSYTSTAIQTASNYAAFESEDECTATENICGVTLGTAKAIGNPPDGTQFNAEKTNLWNSQVAHAPQSAAVSMEP